MSGSPPDPPVTTIGIGLGVGTPDPPHARGVGVRYATHARYAEDVGARRAVGPEALHLPLPLPSGAEDVPAGRDRRYRYSKWRWRILVRCVDGPGNLIMRAWRRFRPVESMPRPQRILVVQLDHLGDAILSSPIFPLLRERYPDAVIDVLASPSNAAYFQADPLIRRVHLARKNWFERRPGPGRWSLMSAIWELGLVMRKERFDIGIDVRGDLATVLMLALARVPRRVGWSMGGGAFLLTDVTPWIPQRHEVASRLALLRCLDIHPPLDDHVRVLAHVRDEDRIAIARRLHHTMDYPVVLERDRERERAATASALLERESGSVRIAANRRDAGFRDLGESRSENESESGFEVERRRDRPLLAIHPGAGTAAKRWPLAHWRALIALFHQAGWGVMLVGGAEDQTAAQELLRLPDVWDWTGKLTVTQTAALLERVNLFVGGDSGPAHLAACAQVPALILFSGTNVVQQWRPWSPRAFPIWETVSCRPCHHKTCPLAGHPCMSRLTPDRVFAAALWVERTSLQPGQRSLWPPPNVFPNDELHETVAPIPIADEREHHEAAWREWLTVGWVVGVGLLYLRMCWMERGGRLQTWLDWAIQWCVNRF